jgi:mitogen-activated protein kinase 1/3
MFQHWKIPPRYELQNLLGSGSYGSVAQAYDRQQDCSVAIKRQGSILRDVTHCMRILREVAILRRLQHPNVVAIRDAVVPSDPATFDELYFTMELCDTDLKKLLKLNINLEPPMIATVVCNLLTGLKYIHSAGIVHRDLKPANCFVKQNGSTLIGDFGLSRVFEIDSQGREKTSPPVAQFGCWGPRGITHVRAKRSLTEHVVSRWWRAPEVILLQKSYTTAIDVWSVGCIMADLLQMLTSGPAFNDRGPLFKGSSCYPLSPDEKKCGRNCHMDKPFEQLAAYQHAQWQPDQLNKIFDILGTPSADDISRLDDDGARQYLQLFKQRPGQGLGRTFSFAPRAAVDAIERMLRFSAHSRVTVCQALSHNFFSAVRDSSKEIEAARPIALPFDASETLDATLLRQYLVEEIHNINGADACSVARQDAFAAGGVPVRLASGAVGSTGKMTDRSRKSAGLLATECGANDKEGRWPRRVAAWLQRRRQSLGLEAPRQRRHATGSFVAF